MINIPDTLNSITLGECINYGIIIAGVISAIIEKSKKLPFNPWSKIFEWVGLKMNKPLYDRMDKIEKQQEEINQCITNLKEDYNRRVDGLERSIDEKEAKRLRSSIMCFSDSCRVKEKHTKQHFENIFRDYDDYMTYCERHDIPNHFIDGEYEYIKSVYQECLKENKFL